MKGVIIYDSIGYKRNTWFCNRLIETARENNVELILKIIDNTDNFEDFSNYSFAIVRTINSTLTKYLELQNIICFNNYKTATVCNDKYETYLMLKKLNLPVMDTYLYDENDTLKLPFPFVVKSVDGHGGTEVYLVKNNEELKSITKSGKKYIYQQFCDTPSVDMRLYMLDAKPVKAVLRKSKGDFRSNFTLGGSAIKVTATNEQIKFASTISKYLGANFIGVDFIYNNEKVVVNEIEDVVGTRMLYSVYNYDITIDFIKHIKNVLKCL